MKPIISQVNYRLIVAGLRATAPLHGYGLSPYFGTSFASKAEFDHLTQTRSSATGVALSILGDLAWSRFPQVRLDQWKWFTVDRMVMLMAQSVCNELLDRIAYRGEDLPEVTKVRQRMHWMICVAGVVTALGLLLFATQGKSLMLLSFLTTAAVKELSLRLLSSRASQRCNTLITLMPLALSSATLIRDEIQSALLSLLLNLRIVWEMRSYLQNYLEQSLSELEEGEVSPKQCEIKLSALELRKREVRHMAYEKTYLDQFHDKIADFKKRRVRWYQNFMSRFPDSPDALLEPTAPEKIWLPQSSEASQNKDENRANWLRVMTGGDLSKSKGV